MPGGMLRVLGCVQVMRVRHVRVVGRLLVVACLVCFGGFGVVMGGLRVVMRRLVVMLYGML